MCAFTLLLLLVIPIAQAEENQAQDLQRQLQQRDQVILELLERVEVLEKELGVQPARVKPSSTDEPVGQTSKPEEMIVPQTGPGVVVVDESVAERALERSLTRDGVLLLPAGVLELEPRIAYSRQEDATPSFVMSGGNVIASETERNSDTLTAALLFRLGLPGDAQLEIGLPYRWRRNETVTNVNFSPLETSSQTGDGPADVRVAIAKTFWREGAHSPDVIGRLTWDTDSGESSDNGVSLGGGFHELQAGLSFIKREDPVVFVGGLSYEKTFEKDMIKPGDTLAVNVGSYVALSPQTSLNFSLSMAYQDEAEIAGNVLEGSDRNIGTLNIGGSTFIGRGTLLNLSLGVGLTEDADDLSVVLSLPMRF
jgi:hypothetical protein